MDTCILVNEGQILSLLPGELGFPLPPSVVWAEEIHHLPAIKDNDMFPGAVSEGLDQPLPLPFTLLLEFTYGVFREIQLVTAIAEIR